MVQNINHCDHGHATTDEVRALPTGGDAQVIICYRHYLKEYDWRKSQIANGVPFQLPEWESLPIYTGE